MMARSDPRLFRFVVPGVGVEPTWYCYRRILSPLRLPIPPPGRLGEGIEIRVSGLEYGRN